MARQREEQIFTADDAKSRAHEVVHHDPAVPRAHSLVPADRDAANAGIAALSAELHALPASIRNALANAESNAGHISEDRLQGLAELLQNADDLGATHAELTVDQAGSRLMFRHNGSGLTLHDVWALAIPWLSLKLDDPDQLGRFGIGLKTLHALSDVLEIHQGHFRVRYEAHDLAPAAGDVKWPGASPGDTQTTFVIPLEPSAETTKAVAAWLSRWSDAGLVFLASLSTVTLLSPKGDELARLHVDRSAPVRVKTTGNDMRRRVVEASDGREWAVYSRAVRVPKGRARSGKAQTKRTPVAIAFPLRGPDAGHLHVGLPVRPIGLPFRLLAQFDPLTSRRDISDNSWNHSLVRPLSALWLDAVLDHFERGPAVAWAAVPLSEELSRDQQTAGQLRAEFDEHLLTDARTAFAREVTLPDGEQRYHLADLAYEAPELEGVLTPSDVAAVAGTPGTVAVDARSADSRWREVLDALREAGAESPRQVEVADAVRLLDEPSRSPAFIADLVAIAAEAGEADALAKRRCLVLDNASRITPVGARGLGVLLPDATGTLWGVLQIGQRLHPAYRQRPGWNSVRDWLRRDGLLLRDATDTDALRLLAAEGDKGTELGEPLTDEQAEALRGAFEQLPQADRQALGVGVGKAVRFAAVTYDRGGKRVTTVARPSEAYIIEREANTWRVAAGMTPGLTWIHSRYSEKLRADAGRDGVGAQRLFRYLGAETAPRLVPHRGRIQRFAYAELGVPRHVSDSPPRRDAQMDELKATYTLGELVSPDLDAVLLDIASEKRREDRVRRANAVLNTLNRAWDRLEPHTRARAATAYYSWQPQGFVDAWWVARAASIPWLTSASGALAAPDHLRIRTAVTEAFFGQDSAQYLSQQFDTVIYQEVLTALGVAGDPRPDQLLGRLRDIRDNFPADSATAGDSAAPLYRAIAAQVRGRGGSRRAGSLNLGTLRTEFGRGNGLIATNVGWRRPPVVRRGPAVFGDMVPFVPAVEGTDPLWDALAVRLPDPSDAKDVLRKLARRRSPSKEQLLVMLNALRILARARTDQVGNLARSSVWVGDRWMAARPVYAVSNPLIAEGLSGQIPMWAPGGALAQLDSLVAPYGLTRIDASHAKVKGAGHAEYDAELTSMFSDAVSNLREDLALSDSSSEASLRLSWDDLANFSVCVLPDLTVILADAVPGTVLSFTTRAWIDTDAATFYVSGPDDVGDPASGAYAVATVFASDTRRIAHDWLAAWAAAMAGRRAEAIKTAASLEAEQKRARAEREAAAEASLRQMSRDSERRRQRKSVTKPSGGLGGLGGTDSLRRGQQPKTLVDLSRLTLADPAGQIAGETGTGNSPSAKGTGQSGRLLRDADRNRPRARRPPGASAPRNYTQEEQESLGAEICRWVLGLDEDEIADIRSQHHVGADAIDQLDNFYEYKVHAGPIPDVIRLEPSQIERARTTPSFFLVVIGNLQAGAGDPEVRIITNPLDQLALRPTGPVQYSGVLAARALTYRFTLDSNAPDEPEESDSGDDPD